MVRAPSRTLYAWLKKILLFKTGIKYDLSTPKRRPMGCAGHNNCMMTRWTLTHLKPVPKTRTPKNGESLVRCNRTNITSRGRHWLRCVLSGNNPFLDFRDNEGLELFLFFPKKEKKWSKILTHINFFPRLPCGAMRSFTSLEHPIDVHFADSKGKRLEVIVLIQDWKMWRVEILE